MSPVEKSINEVLEKLKKEFEDFFSGTKTDIETAESFFSRRLRESTLQLLKAYYEEQDHLFRIDKGARKDAGLSIERRGDERRVLTSLGELEYKRTYYKKASGGYEYPIDSLAGVEAYERVSCGVSEALVETSCRMSYGKASRYVTDGRVSRQTVMNKIRESRPVIEEAEQKRVKELHIDADEDHVHLQDGRSTMVPLISIYEGVEHQGKRGKCKNVFYISEYGKSPSALWEQVCDEIEKRYDLSEAVVYLHGDGASWIKQGLEYIPRCHFVLDRYHKNKAIKQALSGIDRLSGSQYEFYIRKALLDGDKAGLAEIQNRLLSRYPDRFRTINEHIGYLLDNFEAITITNHDPASLNGGCTEPHVSHVLSERLSSRPMGWSKDTLKCFVPILAAGGLVSLRPTPVPDPHPIIRLNQRRFSKKRYLPNTLGLADPDKSVTFPARSNKVTPLFNALRPF